MMKINFNTFVKNRYDKNQPPLKIRRPLKFVANHFEDPKHTPLQKTSSNNLFGFRRLPIADS